MFENISIRKYTGPFTGRKEQAEQYTPEEGAKREVGLAKLFVLHQNNIIRTLYQLVMGSDLLF